mgnify:CR=1 FL=1
MALQKPRAFNYRPPDRRRRQLEEQERAERRPRIDIPRAADGRTTTGGVGLSGPIRLFIILAAIVALAIVMSLLG